MDFLRRDTDYALRAMVNLAKHTKQQSVPTSQISLQEDISYQFTCKLMQKLHNAGLVQSCMGPKGGFRLSKKPSKINLLEIIEAIQGPVSLNRCLLDADVCPRQPKCQVSRKLAYLQKYIDSYFHGITLKELLQGKDAMEKESQKNLNRRKK